MKIVVTLALDVDPEAWDLDYGTGTADRDVRADVKNYVREQIQSCAASTEGGINEVTLR